MEEYREIHTQHYGTYYNVDQVLFEKKSLYQNIQILQTPQFGKLLVLDGYINTCEKDEFIYHEMMVHPAMSRITNPKNALVIGGGDGGVLRELLKYSTLEHINIVEIDEDVIEVSKQYFPKMAHAFQDPRVKVIIEDASKYISNVADHFDVILIDGTDPIGPGKALYSLDFYSKLNQQLNPKGVVFQQTGPASLHLHAYQGVYASLRKSFSYVTPFLCPQELYGGLWSFAFCSRVDLASSEKKNEVSERNLQWYSEAIHQSSLAVPKVLEPIFI